MKTCKVCEIQKPTAYFYHRSNVCKECTLERRKTPEAREARRAYQREYRKRNPDKTRAWSKRYYQLHKKKYMQARRAAYIKLRLRWVEILKDKFGSLSCPRCGYSGYFSAMHFHHNNGTKEHSLAWMMRRVPNNELVGELDKGLLICSNCHHEAHNAINPLRIEEL